MYNWLLAIICGICISPLPLGGIGISPLAGSIPPPPVED